MTPFIIGEYPPPRHGDLQAGNSDQQVCSCLGLRERRLRRIGLGGEHRGVAHRAQLVLRGGEAIGGIRLAGRCLRSREGGHACLHARERIHGLAEGAKHRAATCARATRISGRLAR